MIIQNHDVAIIAGSRSDKSRIGSGILISENLIMTARHVIASRIDHLGSTFYVRLLRDGDFLECRNVWESEPSDLGLLEVLGTSIAPAFEYRLCELRHLGLLNNITITGFPVLAVEDKDGHPRDFTANGSLRLESGDGTLSFAANLADVPWIQERWKGMSGAGVYATGPGRSRDLFGVIADASTKFQLGKLYVSALRESDANAVMNIGREISPAKSYLRSRVMSDNLAEKVVKKFGLVSLYKFATGSLKDDRESPNEFEIDIALDLKLTEIQNVIRGENQKLERLSPRAVLPSAASEYQRILIYLQAPGGYGKSSFLRRVISAAIDQGFATFYLDVKAEKNPKWESIAGFFEDCAAEGCLYDRFRDAVADSHFRTLLVVDGLNEAEASWGDIKSMLNKIADNYADVSIIAADRMNPDRVGLPKSFIRGTLLPVQVERVPGLRIQFTNGEIRQQRLFRVPFFLDKLYKLADGGPGDRALAKAGRAEIIERYFRRYVGPMLNGDEEKVDQLIDALASVANQAYMEKTLELPRKVLERNVGVQRARDLKAAGLISGTADKQFFSHQLLHDYLAGRWLASNGRSVWDKDNFDNITLDARSFDALELASELTGSDAQHLVINIYDWNYRAAIECILNLDAGTGGLPSPLPVELKEAIFAMRAEKMFDVFEHTKFSARAKAGEFRSDFGIQYSSLTSLEHLSAEIRSKYKPTEAGGLYSDWLSLFLADEPISSNLWPRILDSPLLGWTAASVFRRQNVVTRSLIEFLCTLYHALWRSQPTEYGPGIAVRWRIVHVMGAVDFAEALELLTNIVSQGVDDEWVLYGATRGLAEIASRAETEAHARTILAPVVSNLATLTEKVRREVRDVSILSGRAPDWWHVAYGNVLNAGLRGVSPEAGDERMVWENAIETFNKTYGMTP